MLQDGTYSTIKHVKTAYFVTAIFPFTATVADTLFSRSQH